MKRVRRLTFEEFRKRVIAKFEKRIGGKPKCEPDEFILHLGYDKPYSVAVTVDVLVSQALEDSKKPPV